MTDTHMSCCYVCAASFPLLHISCLSFLFDERLFIDARAHTHTQDVSREYVVMLMSCFPGVATHLSASDERAGFVFVCVAPAPSPPPSFDCKSDFFARKTSWHTKKLLL